MRRGGAAVLVVLACATAACSTVGRQVEVAGSGLRLRPTAVTATVPVSTHPTTGDRATAAAPVGPVPTMPVGTAPAVPGPAWEVDPSTSGRPFPGARVEGLLTFRGNPTRSFTGAGPVPERPVVRWSYPAAGGLCRASTDGSETAVWCGTGWTGQPAIWRWGSRWAVAFGAYDGAVHVLDAETGAQLLPPFQTGDLIKGSVSIDPEGYPLLYVGSRDGALRVIALDRAVPTELWRLDAGAVSPTLWNDDWDGSPLVLGDLLLEGGENSQFHVVKLNRRIGRDGLVAVAPRLLFNAPGWDEQLLADLGDTNVSIESSVAVSRHTAWFTNSGGLVQGWDLAAILAGERGLDARTFRFWMGDDTDATIVVDAEGALYVAAEYERSTARAGEVGQLAKLDPTRADPLVWSVPLRSGGVPSGAWATPAIHGDELVVATNAGEVLGIDRATGAIRWQLDLVGPTWGSPVVVDGVLIEGDCSGVLRAWDLADPATTLPGSPAAVPAPRWAIELGGCIESTPAVFGGTIVVGTRAGTVYGLGPA